LFYTVYAPSTSILFHELTFSLCSAVSGRTCRRHRCFEKSDYASFNMLSLSLQAHGRYFFC